MEFIYTYEIFCVHSGGFFQSLFCGKEKYDLVYRKHENERNISIFRVSLKKIRKQDATVL